MRASRGAVHPFLLIALVATIAVAVAWWISQNQTPVVSVPAGQGASGKQDLVASPTSGPSPLMVSFGISRDVNNVSTVDFGDGTSDVAADFICGLRYCVIHHTYGTPGTYAAVFQDASGAALRSVTIRTARE